MKGQIELVITVMGEHFQDRGARIIFEEHEQTKERMRERGYMLVDMAVKTLQRKGVIPGWDHELDKEEA